MIVRRRRRLGGRSTDAQKVGTILGKKYKKLATAPGADRMGYRRIIGTLLGIRGYGKLGNEIDAPIEDMQRTIAAIDPKFKIEPYGKGHYVLSEVPAWFMSKEQFAEYRTRVETLDARYKERADALFANKTWLEYMRKNLGGGRPSDERLRHVAAEQALDRKWAEFFGYPPDTHEVDGFSRFHATQGLYDIVHMSFMMDGSFVTTNGVALPVWEKDGTTERAIKRHLGWARTHMQPILRAFAKASGSSSEITVIGNSDGAPLKEQLIIR